MTTHLKPLYLILLVIFFLLLIYFLLPIIGIDAYGLLSSLLSFSTLYILPWIFLYWFIRLVKAVESK
ncbi:MULTISPECIES: hypothetical protein [Bacillus]|uniref:hypothetical protein n=1 Tax=Bacillus TaxID=1386 RepID=UPI0008E00BED|nr:hypothetical protein [Bacillus sp. WLY-B-L8]SFI51551.1 hypothetical protein SAMN04488574_103143 [Bacillus sp. 71mf]SFS48441.1 hypothetical protein SAMN04488145_101759 [Bacillus sp. 103mf]